MGGYLRAKFEVSSIILIAFRQEGGGGNFARSPPQNEPLRNPPRRLELTCFKMFEKNIQNLFCHVLNYPLSFIKKRTNSVHF